MNRHSPRPLLLVLAILFFCSGMCALIYQVLWLRTLGWVSGVTVCAASTVGDLHGRTRRRQFRRRTVRRPRAQSAAVVRCHRSADRRDRRGEPAGLAGLQRAYVALYPHLPHTLAALTFVRFLIALIVLIVPTALMGATLPLVVKASAFRTSALGRQLGVLYGSNALGAIVGTLAAGLYFIPARGISSTFTIAAALNLAVGATAIVLSRRAPLMSAAAETNASAVAAAKRSTFGARQLTIVLAVFTLSGVISLALEAVWFRVLTLFLRPTVYGFAVMLATILSGIAAGRYIVTPLLAGRGDGCRSSRCWSWPPRWRSCFCSRRSRTSTTCGGGSIRISRG